MDYGVIPLNNIPVFPFLHSFKAHCASSPTSEINPEAKFIFSPLNRGLLANVGGKTGEVWSKQLKMGDASVFLRDVNDYLVKAMKDDGRDIKEIEQKADLYLKSNEVCDREDIIRELKAICEKEGKFVCLLGGKSFGKSKCLVSLAELANKGITSFPGDGEKDTKKNPPSDKKEMLVLVIDMRSQGNKSILLGMIEALDNSADKDVKRKAKKLLKKLFDLWTMLGPLGFIRAYIAGSLVDLYMAIGESLSTEDKIKLCQSLIQELTKTRKVTVIIDEANSAFDRALLDEEQLKQAQADLALLTRLTKQQRQLNVILSSSEHSFPFKLKKMKFNSDDLRRLLFFNEVSPRDCYDLLTNGWGLGENLAISLLNVYGGHLLNISEAINALSSASLSIDKFTTPLSVRATADIVTALESNGGYSDDANAIVNKEATVVKVLTSLAEKGFYPIKKPNVAKESDSQSLEEQLSQLNIAGVIERTSIVPGIPQEMWNDTNCKYALIPASQTMRLMIAEQLVPPPLPSDK